jgi:prepilin-type processing-associated H-X9-DG protein
MAGGPDKAWIEANEPSPFILAMDKMGLVPPYLAPTDYMMSYGSNAGLAAYYPRPRKSLGVFGVNSHTKLTDIKDGTSHTFLIGEGGAGNPDWLLRQNYSDTTPATDLKGQPLVAQNAWSFACLVDRELIANSGNHFMFSSCVGVTAIRDGFNDGNPMDEPMNPKHHLILAAVDYNYPSGGWFPGRNAPVHSPQDGDNRWNASSTYDTLPGFHSPHPGGCHFVFADGSVRFIEETINAATYRALSTIAGGENVVSDY